jgi:hypothetical protein
VTVCNSRILRRAHAISIIISIRYQKNLAKDFDRHRRQILPRLGFFFLLRFTFLLAFFTSDLLSIYFLFLLLMVVSMSILFLLFAILIPLIVLYFLVIILILLLLFISPCILHFILLDLIVLLAQTLLVVWNQILSGCLWTLVSLTIEDISLLGRFQLFWVFLIGFLLLDLLFLLELDDEAILLTILLQLL